MCCPKCNSPKFRFRDWQDERDDVNRICINCALRYCPDKKAPVSEGTTTTDKSEWVEGKLIILYRYDPNELDNARLLSNFLTALEGDGFGECVEVEIK